MEAAWTSETLEIFQPKFCIHISYMRVACPVHSIFLVIITVLIFRVLSPHFHAV